MQARHDSLASPTPVVPPVPSAALHALSSPARRFPNRGRQLQELSTSSTEQPRSKRGGAQRGAGIVNGINRRNKNQERGSKSVRTCVLARACVSGELV